MATIKIPSPLLKLTNNESEVKVDGKNVKELLLNLEEKYPGFKERLYDDTGSLRKFINIYVNEEDIRFLKGENTEVSDNDEVSIIPAIAGGF